MTFTRRVFLPLALVVLVGPLGAAVEPRTILVFPFENRSARPDLAWISESFADVLSSRLESPQRIVLERDERNAAYAQLEIPTESPLTLASEYAIAQALGADWAVVGSFSVEGERLTARAQLLEMRRVKLAPSLEEVGELPELVKLQTRLAWRLLATQDPSFTVGTEEDFDRRFPDVRLNAYENYIRGTLANDDESRVRFLSEADRLDPSDHRAAFELGRYYFGQKDYADSAQWLAKLESKDENYLEALFRLGVDEFFLGHFDSAEKNFEALSRQIPLNEVWNNLGVMKARRRLYEEAHADFDRAHRADPSDPDFCFNLATSLWGLKRYREAAQLLEDCLHLPAQAGLPGAADQPAEDPEAHSLLAAVSAKLGESAAERRELDWLAQHEGPAAAAGDPGQASLPQPRLKKNYDGRAFRFLSLALSSALEERLGKESPEEHGSAHLERGEKFMGQGRLSEAEAELAEAVSLVPKSNIAHLELGQVYESEGRHAEAARELETSLKLRETIAAHVSLGHVYLSLGRPEEAWGQGQQALQLDPGNQDAARLIEQIHARRLREGK